MYTACTVKKRQIFFVINKKVGSLGYISVQYTHSLHVAHVILVLFNKAAVGTILILLHHTYMQFSTICFKTILKLS